MSRRIVNITISGSEYRRDQGKVFVITEMAASQAEAWAMRCFLAMAGAGVDIPNNLMSSGMQGIAVFGLRSLAYIRADDALPLMREMMDCISVMPNPNDAKIVRKLVDDGSGGEDIEEINTRLYLRQEVFKLHADFLQPVDGSTSTSPTTGAAAGSPST